ncbi:ketopantoate reductase family protein [Polynucleobacter sinensis]|uniref:ketopantoate reductase family protein n=1 Tax=Polynucleobacter sinensis TaxID=1743157 RepID=UPI0007813578|nr:2-dehydropantoate 2-reductase [Polynucleobacter sinensis]
MRILIYGSGAIGSNIGGLLAQSGEDVTLLARGHQLAALRNNGLVIEAANQPPRVIPVNALAADEIQGQFDIIFVTLKSMQIEAAAEDIMARLTDDGALVMVQNGLPWWYFDGVPSKYSGSNLQCLDRTGKLKKLIPPERIVGAVIFKPVVQLAPGRILISDAVPARLLIGELNNVVTPRIENIAAIVNKAGLPTFVSNDIRLDKWRKLMINLVWNPLCAITQSAPGFIAASPFAADMVRQLISEGNAVLASLGMDLYVDPEKDLERVKDHFTQQPSMLQDIRAGRPIECDAIVNAVIEIADITGVQVPTLRVVAGILEVINQTLVREQKAIGPIARNSESFSN